MQKVLREKLNKLIKFLTYTKNYLIKNNPIKIMQKELVAGLKDALRFRKNQKLIKKKLRYQMHQLSQMEKMIAENSDHAFLRGNKLNEMR
ncbi:hypothetical protein IJ670_03900 [bacterium]|nr:hypothetical protein [bacterium]